MFYQEYAKILSYLQEKELNTLSNPVYGKSRRVEERWDEIGFVLGVNIRNYSVSSLDAVPTALFNGQMLEFEKPILGDLSMSINISLDCSFL